eukprot:3938369-Pyramimonas_sp.AAC.1
MFVFGHASPKPQVGFTNAAWASQFERLASSKYHNMPRPSQRLTSKCKRGRFNGNKNARLHPALNLEQFVQTLVDLNRGVLPG